MTRYIKHRVMHALCLTLLSACTSSIDHSAFTSEKTYAVVTFGLTPSVQFTDESSSNLDLNEAVTNRMLSTKPVADSMAREFIGGFKLNAPVKILHGRRVTSKKQYIKSFKTSSIKGQKQYITAGRYYYFWHADFPHSKALAKALKVDGVILIYCDLEVSGRIRHLSDGSMKGAYQPEITSRIVAYDKHGKRVMNSRISYKSARKVTPNISGVHYLELRRTLAGYDARLAGMAVAKELWGTVAAGA